MNSPQGEASQPNRTIAPPTGHPRGFWFFFWGEFAERSSFYGMRAILPLYLTMALHFSDTKGGTIYFWFKMAVYFLPLVGGYLADRYFGKYWTIVGFSVPYVLGHFILGVPTPVCLFIALVLLACGSGVIKPNISSLMGLTYDQQRPNQPALRTAAFLWFYFSINIGALISQIAMPLLRDEWGYAPAFQFPAWLMVGSLAIFALGKPFYAVDVIQKRQVTPEEKQQRRAALAGTFRLFGLMVFFWVAYEQNDSLWVFFSRDYVRCVVPIVQWKIPPDLIQFLNAAFVLMLIPFFRLLFNWLDPLAKQFTPMIKMLLGFVATTAAVGIISLAGFLTEHSEISDAGVAELGTLQRLKQLDLSHTAVTTSGVEEIEKTLPNVDIALRTPNIGAPSQKVDKSPKQKKYTADDLKKIATNTDLTTLDLSSSEIDEADLDALKGLKQLTNLNLSHTSISDLGLKKLSGLTQLQTLDLSNTKISDAGLSVLKAFGDLQVLKLGGDDITATAVGELASMSKLQSLSLSGLAVSDEDFAAITKLVQLESLDLSGTKITAKSLPELEKLTNLTSLSLDGIQIKQGAFDQLALLTNLQTLSLAQLEISQNDFKSIAGMKKLESLNLAEAKLTTAGLHALSESESVTKLDLSGTLVDSRDLKQLVPMTRLTSLNLSQTQLGDSELPDVAAIINLETLDLSGTQVSNRGISALKALANLQTLNLSFTHPRVSIWWLILAYFVLTVGEVLVYGTGLELAYALAPANMKSFVTACFLCTNTIGNFINSWLSLLYGGSLANKPADRGPLAPGQFFALTMLISAVTTVAFYFVGRQYDRQARDQVEH